MKFSIKDFFSKCDQILRIYCHIYWRNRSWKIVQWKVFDVSSTKKNLKFSEEMVV